MQLTRQHRTINFWRPGVTRVTWKRNSALWRARFWLVRPFGFEVSIGLYRSELDAHAAWRTVAIAYAATQTDEPPPLVVWRLAKRLCGSRYRSGSLLPKWTTAKRQPDGTVQYFGAATVAGIETTVGPYRRPVSAFRAIWKVVGPTFESELFDD